jgi:cell wall-associated NlpC family hydrolase
LQESTKISTLQKKECEAFVKKKRYAPIQLIIRALLQALLLCQVILVWGGNVDGAVIRDLSVLSQDPLVYVGGAAADSPLLPAGEQEILNAAYDALTFAPWHQTAPRHTLEQVSWGFKEYGNNPGFGGNGKKHSSDWVRKLEANAHLNDYPQGGFPAVTVKRADFRVLPTRDSHSNYPRGTSKDHPFDNLQESAVPAGTPVLVTQISRDRKWLLAETSYALGWVSPADVAAVSPEFMQRWECGRYAAITRDKVPVRDEKKSLLFRAPLGSVFPKSDADGSRIWILAAKRDSRGKAILQKAWVPKAAAEDKPLSLTPRNAARLARELVGEPYGWGGMWNRRDCSSLTRDIFTPFGIWLPRNSREQAETGKFISLKNLPSSEKVEQIINRGVPWRTLLWTPGHIMLYIGVHHGQPLILHNFWSVTTRDAEGNKKRLVVGRAAVTTLQPGRELSGDDLPRADVEGMTLLGEPPEMSIPQPVTTP